MRRVPASSVLLVHPKAAAQVDLHYGRRTRPVRQTTPSLLVSDIQPAVLFSPSAAPAVEEQSKPPRTLIVSTVRYATRPHPDSPWPKPPA